VARIHWIKTVAVADPRLSSSDNRKTQVVKNPLLEAAKMAMDARVTLRLVTEAEGRPTVPIQVTPPPQITALPPPLPPPLPPLLPPALLRPEVQVPYAGSPSRARRWTTAVLDLADRFGGFIIRCLQNCASWVLWHAAQRRREQPVIDETGGTEHHDRV